jgi:tetratricopeptide (TPR) repeat protein
MWAARCAVFTAAGFQPEDFLPGVAYDLRARAWAELGNACRITEELAEAEESFENAMLYLWGGSGQDEALRAQLLDLYASLDRARQRFEQAFGRLDEVYAIYVKLGDFHMAGRALVNKGIATIYANEPEAAIPLIRSGLNWLEQGRDPGLYLCARRGPRRRASSRLSPASRPRRSHIRSRSSAAGSSPGRVPSNLSRRRTLVSFGLPASFWHHTPTG